MSEPNGNAHAPGALASVPHPQSPSPSRSERAQEPASWLASERDVIALKGTLQLVS